MDFKSQIIKALKKETNLKEIQLEIPPNPQFGDYSFPCFQLSKKYKKGPNEIAESLSKKLEMPLIELIKPEGPYLNFYINKELLSKNIIKQILIEKNNYGKSKINKNKILVESPGPNTNKPLHLGHLRNMALGISISNLLEATGNKVTNIDIVNDRGIHIAKSVLAYQKYGKNKNPNKKPDHFVGDFYVLYNKKESQDNLNQQTQELLRKYEAGDKKTIKLFEKMNNWAIKGFKETYKRFGINVDKTYLESKHYKEGKNIIFKELNKKIFKNDKEGNVYINLGKELGKKILLRADGTSLYITQDIYLAHKRFQDYKMNKIIYIVGSEQIYHFKVLFKILKILRYKFADKCYHLPYGMVYLPDGRMKSREGKIIDADNLLDEVKNLAKLEIKKRAPKITKNELNKRSEQIAQGAIKFYLLNRDALKDFTYYPEQSISFEGDTGPYVQYTNARANSILKKVKKIQTKFKFNQEEYQIIKQLSDFPEIIQKSAESYKTNILTNYLLTLSKKFNEYYQKYPVINSEREIKHSRLTLVKVISQVLQNGLFLLGIDAPKKM